MRRRKIWQWLMDLPIWVVLVNLVVGYSGMAFIPSMPELYFGTFPVGIVLAVVSFLYGLAVSWLAVSWLDRGAGDKHDCTA